MKTTSFERWEISKNFYQDSKLNAQFGLYAEVLEKQFKSVLVSSVKQSLASKTKLCYPAANRIWLEAQNH